MAKILRGILKAILWIVGIWLALIIILELTLSQSVLTGLVNRYANEYIDGDLRFGKVSASMFKRFPNITFTLEDFSITYPADRFDRQEKAGIQSHLIYKGCGEERDTLASFRKFTAALNIPALMTGSVNLPYVRLDRPRIFAHTYSDGSSNWDIFIPGENEQTEDIETTQDSDEIQDSDETIKIMLGSIFMTGRPHFVYTDSRDTIFAMADIRRLGFKGRIGTHRPSRMKVGLTLDSMLVAGRVGIDTLSVGVDKLHLHEIDDRLCVDAAAKAYMATGGFGRMMVPVNINGSIAYDQQTVKADGFNIDIAYIPLTAQATLTIKEDATSIDARIGIRNCNVDEVIDKYAENFMPELKQFKTGAEIYMMTSCKGDFEHSTGAVKNIAASLDKLEIKAEGLSLNTKGKVHNVLSSDPSVEIDGKLHADIGSLSNFIPDSLGINAKGTLEAHVSGKARLSQLNLYNFSNSSLSGEIHGDSIEVAMPADTIKASVNGLKITLGPERITSKKDPSRTMTLMGISGEIADADITYGSALEFKTSDFRISAKNVMDKTVSIDTTQTFHPFGGILSASKLVLKDSEGSVVRMDSTRNSFNLFPKKGESKSPVLAFTSKNRRILLRSDVNRAMIANAEIKASASLNTIERRQKIKAFRDSLARVYPDIPKDSLFRHMMAKARTRKVQMPEWMSEEDFRKQDIDISLDKSISGYFRDWDIKGNINVGRGTVMTPHFPLRNSLKGFDLEFNNDKVAINRFDIQAGESNISATGKLTGLRNALLGRRGALKLDVDVKSDRMNANQLLAAYSKGCSFNPETIANTDNISDEEFMEDIVIDSAEVEKIASPLIVVPANLIADIRLDASDIVYSDLRISKATAKLMMKERCLQITDTKAITNMGGINMEGFYATRSKKDLRTGFSLNFNDITAEKVINLMPAIDSIMPLLKSFGGNLNCEVAATAQLDTTMSLIMPSIDGILRISGSNLTIKENDMFKSLAKVLMFRNKKEGCIDKMTVEGVIKDNTLEVFPFILEMDRYMLGMSGVQNMDMSFRYHASLIKSPILIKLGIDVYGSDFDHMKFKLGKAKYKDRNIPVFSTVVDQSKINLVESIRHIYDRGIDAVMKDRASYILDEHKRRIGYVQAVDQNMEDLSDGEKKTLEEEQNKENTDEQPGVH